MTAILQPLMTVMGGLMAFFYAIVPNYVVCIVLLTILVMGLLTPLTIKGTRSMIAAQKLAPELKKLQAEYKNDRQALGEAQMALYKEHNVSPVGGCLPLVVQLPFFFAIDYMLRGLSHTTLSPLPAPGASLLSETVVNATGAPKYVPDGSSLFQTLVESNGHLHSIGLNLEKSFTTVGGGFATKLPYIALIVLSIGSQYYAQRQIQRRNPRAAAANPQMQAMTRILPLVFGVSSVLFPAGLVVYFVTSGLVRICQQWAMYRFDPKLAEHVRDTRRTIEAKVIDKKGGAQSGAGLSKGGSRGGGSRGSGVGVLDKPVAGRSKGRDREEIPDVHAARPGLGRSHRLPNGTSTTPRRGSGSAGGGERARDRYVDRDRDAPGNRAAGNGGRSGRAGASAPVDQDRGNGDSGRARNGSRLGASANGRASGTQGGRPPGRQQPKKSRKGR